MDVTITDKDVLMAADAASLWSLTEDVRTVLETAVPGIVERATADLRAELARGHDLNVRLLGRLERYDAQAWDDLLAERDRLAAQVAAVLALADRWDHAEDGPTTTMGHAVVTATSAAAEAIRTTLANAATGQ